MKPMAARGDPWVVSELDLLSDLRLNVESRIFKQPGAKILCWTSAGNSACYVGLSSGLNLNAHGALLEWPRPIILSRLTTRNSVVGVSGVSYA